MFNQDEGKIENARLETGRFGFWLGKKSEIVLIPFLTSWFAAFICLWLLVLPNSNNLINHVLIPKNQVQSISIVALCLYYIQRENLVFKNSLWWIIPKKNGLFKEQNAGFKAQIHSVTLTQTWFLKKGILLRHRFCQKTSSLLHGILHGICTHIYRVWTVLFREKACYLKGNLEIYSKGVMLKKELFVLWKTKKMNEECMNGRYKTMSPYESKSYWYCFEGEVVKKPNGLPPPPQRSDKLTAMPMFTTD